MPRRRAHYVLSTHWDREWYEPFQHYRYRLVRVLDDVLEGLVDGRLAGPFQTDGQAIILDDYLEVRPERRGVVEDLARRGRLVIGPWYVLPDEFLVGPESLIRNVRLGRRRARELGANPSQAGFACDLFGHISQLPQLLRGFGIDFAFLWRGVHPTSQPLVRWRGADGTEILAYRFGSVGYCTYAHAVRRAFDGERAPEPDQTAQRLEAHLQEQFAQMPHGPVLLFDGADHLGWDQPVYEALRHRMGQEDRDPEIVHTSLDAFLGEARTLRDQVTTVLEGELREPGRDPAHVDLQWLIPGVLSSRVWIKQENQRCETLLTRWAEPMGALAHLALGDAYPRGFLDVAWKWLLQNHPHDSICGCSVDQVHEDMKYRFSQCHQIAERLAAEATSRIAAAVDADVSDHELRVVLFNPLPEPYASTVELTLPIPADWPTFDEFFRFEPKPAFRIYDAGGAELPYQRLGQCMGRQKMHTSDTRFPVTRRTNDVRVAVPVRVAALGYTTLRVRAAELRPDAPCQPVGALPTRHPAVPGLATSACSMANAAIAVAIEANGSITLTDRRSGEVYRDLLIFEDIADIGDGWYHGQAVNDQSFVSTACAASVALVHDGPQVATFRVRTVMPVPASFRFDQMQRSGELAELVLDSLLTLRHGAEHLEVSTTVSNVVQDHRLRVLLPSGATGATTYLADSAFDVVERPIALRADNHTYRELEVETKPQQCWTAVFGPRRGLAVVAPGLLETAVRDQPSRPLALTLLRATRRTVFTDGQPGGQIRGDWQFRYAVVPLSGAPDVAGLGRLGQRLATGLRAVSLRRQDVARLAGDRRLPAEAGLLRIEGPALLSALELVESALEVRVHNPTADSVAGSLCFDQAPFRAGRLRRAQPVDLEGRPVGPAQAVQAGRIPFELGPKQFMTFRVDVQNGV